MLLIILKPENIFYSYNLGKVFTLSNFIITIYHFSIYHYIKYQGGDTINNNNSQNNILYSTSYSKFDKLILFLEKLEHSKGVTNFELRFNIKLKDNFSFFPEKEREMKEIKEKKQLEYMIKLNSSTGFKNNLNINLSDNNPNNAMYIKAYEEFNKINNIKKNLNSYQTLFESLDDFKDISFEIMIN